MKKTLCLGLSLLISLPVFSLSEGDLEFLVQAQSQRQDRFDRLSARVEAYDTRCGSIRDLEDELENDLEEANYSCLREISLRSGEEKVQMQDLCDWEIERLEQEKEYQSGHLCDANRAFLSLAQDYREARFDRLKDRWDKRQAECSDTIYYFQNDIIEDIREAQTLCPQEIEMMPEAYVSQIQEACSAEIEQLREELLYQELHVWEKTREAMYKRMKDRTSVDLGISDDRKQIRGDYDSLGDTCYPYVSRVPQEYASMVQEACSSDAEALKNEYIAELAAVSEAIIKQMAKAIGQMLGDVKILVNFEGENNPIAQRVQAIIDQAFANKNDGVILAMIALKGVLSPQQLPVPTSAPNSVSREEDTIDACGYQASTGPKSRAGGGSSYPTGTTSKQYVQAWNDSLYADCTPTAGGGRAGTNCGKKIPTAGGGFASAPKQTQVTPSATNGTTKIIHSATTSNQSRADSLIEKATGKRVIHGNSTAAYGPRSYTGSYPTGTATKSTIQNNISRGVDNALKHGRRIN